MLRRPRVVVSGRIPGTGVERLRVGCDVSVLEHEGSAKDFMGAIVGASAVLTQVYDRVDAAALDAAGEQLRVVANYGAGVDNIDVAECTSRGVFVGHTPGVVTEATADLTMALLLTVARKVVQGDQEIRRGQFRGMRPDYLLGSDVAGATIGIIGFGHIGQAVALRASQGFGMRVLGVDAHWRHDSGRVAVERCSLEDLLGQSDFVSCHVPLTAETWHLLGREEFRAMRSSATVINTSRGPIVDEAALVDALRSGEIAGAGLDVYEHEPEVHPGLTGLTSVVLSPHIGSATTAVRSKMGNLAAQTILEVLNGRRPVACVNSDMRPAWR